MTAHFSPVPNGQLPKQTYKACNFALGVVLTWPIDKITEAASVKNSHFYFIAMAGRKIPCEFNVKILSCLNMERIECHV